MMPNNDGFPYAVDVPGNFSMEGRAAREELAALRAERAAFRAAVGELNDAWANINYHTPSTWKVGDWGRMDNAICAIAKLEP